MSRSFCSSRLLSGQFGGRMFHVQVKHFGLLGCFFDVDWAFNSSMRCLFKYGGGTATRQRTSPFWLWHRNERGWFYGECAGHNLSTSNIEFDQNVSIVLVLAILTGTTWWADVRCKVKHFGLLGFFLRATTGLAAWCSHLHALVFSVFRRTSPFWLWHRDEIGWFYGECVGPHVSTSNIEFDQYVSIFLFLSIIFWTVWWADVRCPSQTFWSARFFLRAITGLAAWCSCLLRVPEDFAILTLASWRNRLVLWRRRWAQCLDVKHRIRSKCLDLFVCLDYYRDHLVGGCSMSSQTFWSARMFSRATGLAVCSWLLRVPEDFVILTLAS